MLVLFLFFSQVLCIAFSLRTENEVHYVNPALPMIILRTLPLHMPTCLIWDHVHGDALRINIF